MSRSSNNARREGASDNAQAGYTLLEFLVAFAILVVVLASLLTAFAVAMRGDRQASFLTFATLLARSKLASAGQDFPLRPGTTAARFDNGYEWRAVVRSYGSVRLGESRQAESLWVDVTVSDPASNGSRSLTLSSLEIAPRSGP
ncbi:General secretion pathway protein I [Bosea sp. LC85]|uniref:type II secretion system protein n=1 Tax=Bosea sp. LC85 TaxID=1502851 RepID=UPI0004E2C83B|nr:type II secretion system protein [Bosea sp. LC85]KFC69668.1 General secretion pathway protein I [Bosea sp. LC85]